MMKAEIEKALVEGGWEMYLNAGPDENLYQSIFELVKFLMWEKSLLGKDGWPDPFYEIPFNKIAECFEDYGVFGENALPNVLADIPNYCG